MISGNCVSHMLSSSKRGPTPVLLLCVKVWKGHITCLFSSLVSKSRRGKLRIDVVHANLGFEPNAMIQ